MYLYKKVRDREDALASHAGRMRSLEFGCDVVEVVLSFALSLGDVTRF